MSAEKDGGARDQRRRGCLILLNDVIASQGGIQKYNRNLVRAAAGLYGGVAVVVATRESTGRAHGETGGILGHGVSYFPLGGGAGGALGKVAFAARASRKAVALRPSVLICGHANLAPLSALLARIVRASLVAETHGVEVWSIGSAPLRRALAAATLVHAPSRYTRDRLVEQVGSLSGRVRVIPEAVDLQRFQPAPRPADLARRLSVGSGKVLLTVGRLSSAERYKGHDRVLRALAVLLREGKDLCYIVAGGGDDLDRLKAEAGRLGVSDRVRWVGPVPETDLPRYYHLADVHVMPSTGEGFGVVFIEAAACGKPSIGGNRDGSPDALLDGRLGQLVDPEKDEEIVEAIRRALDGNLPPHLAVPGLLRATTERHFSFEAFQRAWSDGMPSLTGRS